MVWGPERQLSDRHQGRSRSRTSPSSQGYPAVGGVKETGPSTRCRVLARPPPMAGVWAGELRVLCGSHPTARPRPPTLTPALPPNSQQRKGQTQAGGGERPGKLGSVCFGLILAFLLRWGPGPQIWHFLFGLGQRSAALKALAPVGGRACCFPSSHDPSSPAGCPAWSPALLLQLAPSPLVPQSQRSGPGRRRKFRLGDAPPLPSSPPGSSHLC